MSSMHVNIKYVVPPSARLPELHGAEAEAYGDVLYLSQPPYRPNFRLTHVTGYFIKDGRLYHYGPSGKLVDAFEEHIQHVEMQLNSIRRMRKMRGKS